MSWVEQLQALDETTQQKTSDGKLLADTHAEGMGPAGVSDSRGEP